MNEEIIKESEDSIDFCLGDCQWVNAEGRFILEEDFSVGGEIWRVNKYDADPLPSNPHAHYIAGKERFVGCKLHLGTAVLYRGREPLGRKLYTKQFQRLIDIIRPKFPNLILPLPN
jgi:hypothetical protein